MNVSVNKYLSESFRRMDELSAKKKLQIKDSEPTLNNQFIEIWKSGNEFEFTIENCSFQLSTEYSSIFDTCCLFGNTKSYSFLKNTLRSASFDVQNDKTTGTLNSIIESESEKITNSYIRLIQPINEPAKIGYIDGFVDLKTDTGTIYPGGLNQFLINGNTIEVFKGDKENNNCLIIDSCSKIDFEDFQIITAALFAAYAFLFGNYFGNEAYFIFSNENSFDKINQVIFIKKSVPFNESYPIFNRKIPSQKGLIFFPKFAFQNICNSFLTSERFSRTLNTINEALQSTLALTKCILFSAALETITSLINEGKIMPKPVNSKHLENEQWINNINQLTESIKKRIEDDKYITGDEKSFLIDKKLNYWNELPNKEKASMAFKSFGIELPKSLEKTLNYRNFYLHGSIPDKKKKQFGFETDNLKKSYELQFLVSILILKYAGYSGYVQNKSAILEYHAHRRQNKTDKIKLDQSIFYKI